uniref:Uncharacterized protein n=1 Tax=Terrapene triunguis TaxID=2587831 RepID=A0A674I190_9SAUR
MEQNSSQIPSCNAQCRSKQLHADRFCNLCTRSSTQGSCSLQVRCNPHTPAMLQSISGQLLTGLTSRRMEDLATRPGFLDFFSAYWRSRSSRTLAASWSSSSSPLPNRSMSSSSSSSSASDGPTFFAGGAEGSSTFFGGALQLLACWAAAAQGT